MGKGATLTYIKDIALKLHDPKMFGGASLMVGAGFSKNAEGIGYRVSPPDWSELAAAMYEELYPTPSEEKRIKNWTKEKIVKTSGKNTLRLAEEYIAFFDRNKMNTLIENNISDEMFVPGELHRRLLKLNWKDIFTTNYDTLLERTCDEILQDKEYKVILSQDNLPGSSSGLARIIKLHGSIPSVRPYIISEEDYRCYPMKYAAFVNTVQQSLIETTLCMIGFSGDDPNFLSWHGWLHDNLGENCPQIYLINLFGNMNDSEKEVLRKRKIALVDLETLLEGNEHNKYEEAYKKFLSIIEAESKDVCFEDNAPYINKDPYKWEKSEEDTYVLNMLEFSNEILEQEGDYVLLPEAKRDKYRNYFSDRFDTFIFKCKNINTNFVHTLSNLIKLQMMCLIPLYDNQADQLKSICKSVEERDLNVKLEWRLQIDLYLLQMYRIDGDEEKYQQIITVCEKYLDQLPDSNKTAYWIELVKHAAAMFDIEKMKCTLDKIAHTNIKNEIAKAGLYLQIGERDLSEKILKECLDELRKKRLDAPHNASYKSYLSLCYAASGNWMRQDSNYSDSEYKDNEYRTRTIILDLENQLREEILNSTVKDDTKANVFEVNRNRGNSITFGQSRLQRLSFEFILMLDMLCLPIFTDQSILLPTAMEKILHTSNNTYWKFSFMIRSNNKDVIERILSRRGIAIYELEEMQFLYRNIWNCVQKTKYKNFEYRHSFLSLNNALDVLSRMAVYLDDTKIIELIKFIVGINHNDNEQYMSNISNILQRLSTRFNGSIAAELKDELFAVDKSKLCLASYFNDVNIMLDDNVECYSNAIELVKSNDIEKRDNGIAQLLILWRNSKNEKFSKQIEEAIWKKETNILPGTKKFNVVIWEELPYPTEVNFADLYKDYILGGLGNPSNGNVFQYINLFYLTSPMSNDKYTRIKWDADCLTGILNAVADRINKIKNDSGIEIWGFDTEKLQKRYLNEFTVMLYALGQADLEIAKTLPIIEKAIGLLNEKGTNGSAFEAIKTAVSGDYMEAIGKLKDAFWSNDEKVISEASLGLQGVLYILKQNNGNTDVIKDTVLEIMQTLQYSDIKYVKSIWNILKQLIRRVFNEDDIYQAKLAEIFEKCMRSYSYQGKKGDKYYFEAMYNCNMALKSYHDQIIENDFSLNAEMKKTINYVKSMGIFELLTIWK